MYCCVATVVAGNWAETRRRTVSERSAWGLSHHRCPQSLPDSSTFPPPQQPSMGLIKLAIGSALGYYAYQHFKPEPIVYIATNGAGRTSTHDVRSDTDPTVNIVLKNIGRSPLHMTSATIKGSNGIIRDDSWATALGDVTNQPFTLSSTASDFIGRFLKPKMLDSGEKKTLATFRPPEGHDVEVGWQEATIRHVEGKRLKLILEYQLANWGPFKDLKVTRKLAVRQWEPLPDAPRKVMVASPARDTPV